MAENPSPQNRYQLGEILGRGGMGVVYKAWDTQMKREVALKTLLDVDNTAALELFYKEWGVLATIVHPNIVGIYDVGETELDQVKRPFFVMPLLRGVTLEQLIRARSPRLSVEASIGILTQACRGLHAAHELGLIHRDMKPSNIFVMEDDSVKLIDFGIARLARMASGTTLKGTIHYMAPEQFQMKPPSPLTDLFSLAVVCYETLSGRRPFQGATDSEVIAAVIHQNPPALSDLNANVSYAVSQVIHKGLAKHPWHRFGSVREFGEAMQKALRNEPLEYFDPAAIQPRIERAVQTFDQGDYEFASELLAELEGEGHLDPKITLLRRQLDQAMRQVRVRKLLETVRRFLEAHEYPLALRKLHDALELDPENAEALALKTQIERASSAKKIDEWMALARQHLETLDFRQARETLQNLLKLKPNDPELLRFAAEIDRREQDLHRSREQKSRLYKLALEGWEKGDIAAAFNRLEALMALVRDQPDPGGQGDMYQKFYEQVRAERDAINAAYDEARRRLGAGDFEPALVICRQYLTKFPNHALFQALKYDVEEKDRQRLSAFLAETDRRVDQESDPERRVEILERALERHPGDAHLERALRLAREKRDLVDSIVTRARYLEEKGQFDEALDQWEVLRAIHPVYPTLDDERGRLVEARERQSELETRTRWLEQVEQYRSSGDYDRAAGAVLNALSQYPDDAELLELEEAIRQGQARTGQAMALLEQSRQFSESGRPDEGLRLLHEAHEVDPADTVVTTVLVNSLYEQAQRLLKSDWEAAEPLVQQILNLDPQHAGARGLQTEIGGRRRENFLDWCTAQAHQLQAGGDLAGARAVLEKGLQSYPNEPRLAQLRAALDRDAAAPPEAATTDWRPLPASASPPDTAFPEATSEEPPEPPSPVAETAAPEPPRSEAPRPRTRRPAPPPPASRRWIPLLAVAVMVIVAAAVVAVILRSRLGRPRPQPPAEARVVSISAHPSGASLLIDGQPCGVSQCEPRLAPGPHRAEARLAGYQSAVADFTVEAAGAAPVLLTLAPAASVVRLLSDLEGAAVSLDDQPVGQIQNGEFELRNVSVGAHTLEVAGAAGKIAISFETAEASPPWLRKALEARGLRALVVAGLGASGRLYSSVSGEAAVDGAAAGTVSAEGLELKNLAEGSHELVVTGAGNVPHKLVFTADASPTVTAFLGADTRLGGLRIQTSEDDVAVFLNGQRYRRTTQRGRLLLSLAPKTYTVRVAKEGFPSPPEQTVEVRRGEEARLEFQLRPAPKFASFRLRNGAPGAELLLDGKPIGTVGPDGAFVYPKLDPPGKHTLVVRKESYKPRQFDLDFLPGVMVELEGSLETTLGTLRIEVTPAGAGVQLALRREGDASDRPVSGTSLQLPEGVYRITASGAGYQTASTTARVAAGRTATASLAVHKVEVPKAPAPPPPSLTLADWEKTGGWTREGPLLSRRGGNVVVAPLAPMPGTYVFTILLQRGSRLEWLLNYRDERNCVQYQLDKSNFSRAEVVNGRRSDAVRTPHQVNRDEYLSLQIDVTSEAIIHRIRRDGQWQFLDEFRKPGGLLLSGPFAFRVGGRDQIALSDFRFLPR